MPKRKRRDTPEKQAQRFVETARALEVDETGKSFERAMRVLAKPKSAPKRGK